MLSTSLWDCVTPLVVLVLVLEIGALPDARWRSFAVRDGTGQLGSASNFDVTSIAVNIFAPFCNLYCSSNESDNEANGARSSVRRVAAVELSAIRTRNVSGRRRA